jgi:hypothetical protein
MKCQFFIAPYTYNYLDICVASWHAKIDVMFIRAINQLAADWPLACLTIVFGLLMKENSGKKFENVARKE